jgi:hypothetical protein
MTPGSPQKCPRCGYLRRGSHPSREDTCPWCNAVYWKAAEDAKKRQRRRKQKHYEDFLRNECSKCGESFSILAKKCPYCEQKRSRKFQMIASSVLISVLATLAVLNHFTERELTSPFPRIGDMHYQRCIQLSSSLLDAKNRGGDDMSAYLRLQGEWHGKCSRAALGTLNDGSSTRLPSTPEGWLQSVNDF